MGCRSLDDLTFIVPIVVLLGPQVVRETHIGPSVIVSVTTLGSMSSGMARAAGQVVDYLEGGEVDGSVEQRRSQAGSMAPELDEPPSIGGYFADSAEQPGAWRGHGAQAFGLVGPVDSESFLRLLQGQDPTTGKRLVGPQGSNGRAEHHSPARPSRYSSSDDLLSAVEVADLASVDVSYVRRIANKTARVRETQTLAQSSGDLGPELPTAYLDAAKGTSGAWSIRRHEAERFAAGRGESKVVLGYDVTWSAPKSVSALYAQGTDADRQAIMDSMETAVTAGMENLEADGFHVRRGRGREIGSNMVAASYRHFTNRALEPQLHEHVVIANMATNSKGETHAVDARGLFAHATTAGYLAAAELRTQLTRRLGVAWERVHNGVADIAGVDRDVIMAISSRRKAVLSLADEMGYSSPAARQAAALATRPAKDRSVEAAQLRASWRTVLNDVGFDAATVGGLRNRQQLDPWKPEDTAKLFAHLASEKGVTEHSAVFDRRHVLQAVADFAGDRLTAAEIVEIGDSWLRTEAVIPLETQRSNRGETIGHGAAQVSLAPDEQRYTTPEMFALELEVIARHRRGLDANLGVVGSSQVEAAITRSNVDLGADQAAMIRSICQSGDQFQAVVGRAGAGKTTALRAAVEAWQTAGFNVRGAAPFGEAARNLEAETGLQSTTLEGLLTRLDHAANPGKTIGSKTVIIVDEASTIGNRQLGRLYDHARNTGAIVRTVGDPHQHQSVEAGGLWKHLTTEFAAHTPSLDINRRQTGPAMGEVRLALDEYRAGHINAAMARLDKDNRIVTAASWDELLDMMTADWFVDHQHHLDDGAAVSKMIAERNSDRHALNQRAQTLLRSNDALGDPHTIGDADFHVGDRVVAQATNRDLYPEDDRRRHVINGSQGTVTAIRGSHAEPSLVVDFDGLGPISVPHEFISTEVSPGRGGGLSPGYAVTSYKAEGQTYDTGRNLATADTINAEGMYVALSRGRNDQRTYTLAPSNGQDQRPELPVVPNDRSAIEALNQSLKKNRDSDLASVIDPGAAERVAELSRLVDVTLRELLDQRRTAQKALDTANQVVDKLSNTVEEAKDRRFETLEQLDALLHKHEATEQPRTRPWGKKDITASDIARGDLETAKINSSNAETKYRTGKKSLAEHLDRDQARPALSTLIATIDRAVDKRISSAVEQPSAPYLSEVLGERPSGRHERQSWDKAATSIETYRHRHLGITPDAGAFSGDGIDRAIGQPPKDIVLRLRFWKQAHRHIQEHVAPQPQRDLGVGLSL